MTIADGITRICNIPTGKIGERLKSEIRFATHISKKCNGDFDTLLNSVINQILSDSDESGFINDKQALEYELMLEPMYCIAKAYELHCVSHAHIDMNWMWGFQETTNIVLDTFRTMLKLMEEYPSFTFSQSQASVYKITEEFDPELFEQILDRVHEGRWEVTASTWTEADKNIPASESFARHILYTKKYFKEKFGLQFEDLNLDFEPDTFGHSLQIPEILNNGGVKYYYHCRGDEIKFAYRYRSLSGNEVLCYQDPFFYNGKVDGGWFEYMPDLAMKQGIMVGLRVYGVGDHGGGPSRRDIERLLDMQTWPLAPTILFSTYRAFFQQLEKYKDTLPIIDTERNYIFTGCYSSQSRIKSANRIAEDRLYMSETASTLDYCFTNGFNYSSNYEKAWQKVMFNHFHDILPGSCILDSREHAIGEYQNAMAYANAGMTKALMSISNSIDSSSISIQEDKQSISEGAGVGFNSAIAERCTNKIAERGTGITRVLHFFNTTQFDRNETTEVVIWDWPGDEDLMEIKDSSGGIVPFFIIEKGDYWEHNFIKLYITCKVSGFGYSTYIICEKERKTLMLQYPYVTQTRVDEFPLNILENESICVEFDNNMCLISLIDKKNGQQLIDQPSGYFAFVEESTRHDKLPSAWSEGDVIYESNINREGRVYITKRDYNHDIRQWIKYTIEYRQVRLDITLSLLKDSTILRYSVTTKWKELGEDGNAIPTLRFRVPVSYAVSGYLYEIPFGTILRDDVNHDAPSHSFLYGCNEAGGNGVCILSDTINAYRGEKNILGATLLRASCKPDDMPEFGSHANEIGIGLLPFDKYEIYTRASAFVYPLSFVSVCPHKGILPMDSQFIKVEGRVAISTVKVPEECYEKEMIIRLYNLDNTDQLIKITFVKDLISACIVDINENPMGILLFENRNISFLMKANVIMTIKAKF